MVGKYYILVTKRFLEKGIVRAIVVPQDKKLWPELRQHIINFRIDPSDPVLPHRGIVYVAFFGNYFGPDGDNLGLWSPASKVAEGVQC